jgi:flagellar motor protein MotB
MTFNNQDFPMNAISFEQQHFDLSPEDLQINHVDQAGWMITYLDVFILTAALFATLLAMQPTESQATTALSTPLPANVEMHWLQDGQAELNIGSSVLFSPAEAGLRLEGQFVIDQLIPLIQETRGLIVIQGHTDSLPIATHDFPSNWELAGARAMNVLHYLVAQGVEKDRLRMISFADTQPLVPNTSEANRQKNRRVSIILQP